MKKRFAFILSLVLMAAMCMGVTAYALTPAPEDGPYMNEPPLPATPASCPVAATVSVAGKTGNRYVAGDLVVITASMTNGSTEPVSGQLWLTYPAGIGDAVSYPADMFERKSENGCWSNMVQDLAPGERAELVVVVRAAEECDTADWAATAEFLISDGGGACAVVAEGHFGYPLVKADKSALLKDGLLKIRNTGNGGASRVKFRFLAKKAWQTDVGLPDGMKYIGDGRIEVEIGGLAAGGRIEKDISGILHQRLDPKGELELVYETDLDGPVEYAEWVDGPVE